MTATDTQFAQHLSTQRVPDEKRMAILADPGFGNYFTDHTAIVDFRVDETGTGGWQDARLEPYGPIALDPAAAVLHYGQEIFEGMKAYRHADGSIWTFRADANAARLNRSAVRLALPQLPAELFLESLRQLVSADQDWIPSGDGESLYLRPFMIATEAFLGVRPAREVSYRVIASPAGNYFGGEVKPVDIWVSRTYARAGRGGTGAAKAGGNYASSLAAQLEAEAHGCKQVLFLDQFNDNAVEELGGMNVFFVFRDGSIVTPALSGTILEGVTRSSVIQLGRDRGLEVTERKITLDEWRDGVASGEITEVFACGTAAVITPIGQLRDGDDYIGTAGAPAGEVTMSIRSELLGIQTGAVEDTHGWLTRLV
ncbi:branched-chain amino acid aminotransferase [Arthrobacter agilis]|uniref:branched-chain amino acid aminotransferase n=1 Tax=Arthrobacter agilis TaxID=37921 RepID=UPI000B35BE3F|nr:branched-chain amino acid aminotransferase [Arthrobacter agilis]OUM44224.1 branched chain amino acid aminotransferase [Arthrobacter agilis]PPB46599.1 branched-chain amino acid aminotransferase [Arthrobacter agilis]TPV23742.1 branched-chain amino acid aminotransferase [Arthrobacter agilis]WDF32175.1 branched-chain amino acid aminotransferase [Arthrobacter agilis]VDR32471.1 Branched-chain-amino-acid aminotransferase [Arthrobacter agilis]